MEDPFKARVSTILCLFAGVVRIIRRSISPRGVNERPFCYMENNTRVYQHYSWSMRTVPARNGVVHRLIETAEESQRKHKFLFFILIAYYLVRVFNA